MCVWWGGGGHFDRAGWVLYWLQILVLVPHMAEISETAFRRIRTEKVAPGFANVLQIPRVWMWFVRLVGFLENFKP